MEEIKSDQEETSSKKIKGANGFVQKNTNEFRKNDLKSLQEQELLSAFEIKKLMNQCEIFENDNKNLKKQLTQLTKDMSMTTNYYDDLLNVIEMLKLNNTNIQEKLKEKDGENLSLRKYIEDLVNQQTIKNEQLDEFTKELNFRMEKWKTLISEKEQEINILNAQLTNIQDLFLNSDNMDIKDKNKIKILSEKLAKREEQILELVDLLSKTSLDLHLIKSSLDQFEDNMDFNSNASIQRTKIRNLNEELKDIKEQLKQAEEEASLKSEQISELIIHLREYETGEYGLAGAVNDIKKLKQEIKSKDKTIQELISKLNLSAVDYLIENGNMKTALTSHEKKETNGTKKQNNTKDKIKKQLEIVNVQNIDILPLQNKIEESPASKQPIIKFDKGINVNRLSPERTILIKDNSSYEKYISHLKNLVATMKLHEDCDNLSPVIFTLELILHTFNSENTDHKTHEYIIYNIKENVDFFLDNFRTAYINNWRKENIIPKSFMDLSIQVDSKDFFVLETPTNKFPQQLFQTSLLDEQIKKYNSLVSNCQNIITKEIQNSESNSQYLTQQNNIIQGVLNELTQLRTQFSLLIQLIPLKDLAKILFNLSQEKEKLIKQLKETETCLKEKQEIIYLIQNILKQFNEEYKIFPEKDIFNTNSKLTEILINILYSIRIKNDQICKLNEELKMNRNNFHLYKLAVAKEQEGLHLILQTKQQCIQKLIEKYKELSQQSAPNSNEILEFLSRINSLEDEIEELKKDKNQLKEQLTSSLEENDKLKSSCNSKAFEIDDLQKEIDSYKSEITTLSEKLAEKEIKKSGKRFLKTVENVVKKSMITIKNEIPHEILEDKNTVELEEYKAKVLQINAENSSLISKINHLNERNSLLQKRIEHMERIFITKEKKFNLIKGQLQQEVKTLSHKFNELKNDYNEEFGKVKARKNQCEIAYNNWWDKKKHQKSIESLKLLLTEKKQEIIDLSKRNLNLERYINRLQNEKKHLQYILGIKEEQTNSKS